MIVSTMLFADQYVLVYETPPPPPPRAHWASTYTELFFLLRLPRFSIVHKQPALSLTITVDNADQPERAPDGQRRLHVTEAKG